MSMRCWLAAKSRHSSPVGRHARCMSVIPRTMSLAGIALGDDAGRFTASRATGAKTHDDRAIHGQPDRRQTDSPDRLRERRSSSELGGGLYRCLCWWKRSVLRDVVVALRSRRRRCGAERWLIRSGTDRLSLRKRACHRRLAPMKTWHWYDPPVLFPLFLILLIVGFALLRTAEEDAVGTDSALSARQRRGRRSSLLPRRADHCGSGARCTTVVARGSAA